MKQIAQHQRPVANNGQTDASPASLLDQRDQYIDQMSRTDGHPRRHQRLNQVNVFTNSGVQLVGAEAAKLTFNPQGTVTPNTL